MRARPQSLILFLRYWVEIMRRVDIGPRLPETVLNEDGGVSFLTRPISGAPGAVLTVSPPEKTEATVPKPVLHRISET